MKNLDQHIEAYMQEELGFNPFAKDAISFDEILYFLEEFENELEEFIKKYPKSKKREILKNFLKMLNKRNKDTKYIDELEFDERSKREVKTIEMLEKYDMIEYVSSF